MTTHNAIIYHCVVCGRVEHAEVEAEHPQCCGRAMDKACGESIAGTDAEGQAIEDTVADRTDQEAGRKPR